MIVDDIDHRVWAALRVVDAITAQPVDAQVEGTGQRWLRNGSGLWVLNGLAAPTPQADAWQAYEDGFLEPGTVTPPLALRIHVRPEGQRQLPRGLSLRLPLPEAQLLTPITVPLYPAPASPVALGWALLRVQVSQGGRPLAGAVLSLHEGDALTPRRGRGQTDARGEAVVVAAGLPAWVPSGGAQPFVREHALQLHVVGTALPAAFPDPDDLATQSGPGFVTHQSTVLLASGRSTSLTLELP